MEHQHLPVSQLLTFDQIQLFPFVNQSSVSSIPSPKTVISNIAQSQSLTINDGIFHMICM